MDELTWLGLGLNAALVIITGVYALLTRKLSKSSAAAAESAAESARAAADSARSQRAAIEAEINRRHAWFKTSGGGRSYREWEMLINPLVGAYVLRRVVLRDVDFMPATPGKDGGARSTVRVDVNRELTPKRRSMPVPVDEVEGARFEVDIAAIASEAFPDDQWSVVNWSCEITFSLSEFTDSQRRVIVHLDPEMDNRRHRLKQAREFGFD